MAYEYSEKVLERWEYPAQAALYREKFLHQQQETIHWRGRATAAETRLLALYQEREKTAGLTAPTNEGH